VGFAILQHQTGPPQGGQRAIYIEVWRERLQLVGAETLTDHRRDLQREPGIRGETVEQFLGAPPDGWIVGTVEQAAEQLNAVKDAGVSRVMCQHLAHDDLEFIAVLARELAPPLA